MLGDFAFLGAEKAKEIVVTNTNKIADEIDDVHPLKDKLYTPKMEGAEDEIKSRTMDTAHKWYGHSLPKIVANDLIRNSKVLLVMGSRLFI